MKLMRTFVAIALIASACALSACTSGGACCDPCGAGDPCACP
ncbi:MAG: hypothetical protein QNJ90_13260 [Planctomycetota bacterium]|nr:hypothetical protein [Planctomycetota bacterium]